MRGLLLKDSYTLIRSAKLFGVLILVLCCVPTVQTLMFAVFYTALLPISAMAYDEQSKWGRIEAMMPYSTMDRVLSKYILGIGLVAVCLCISIVSNTLIKIASAGNGPDITALIMAALVGTIFIGINMPIMLRFGTTKGRTVYIFVFVALFMAVSAFMGSSNIMAETIMRPGAAAVAVTALAALVLNVISIKLSCLIYERARKRG